MIMIAAIPRMMNIPRRIDDTNGIPTIELAIEGLNRIENTWPTAFILVKKENAMLPK